MLTSLRWFATAALLAGCVTVVPSALASKNGRAFAVEDGAKLFGADAVERANEKIEKIKRDYDKDLLVVTLKSVPDADRDKVKNKDDRGAYFDRYANKQYERHGVKGIYVLICNEPKWAEVVSGKETQKTAFTPADRRAARKVLVDNLKEDPDKALLAFVDEVDRTLKLNGVKPSSDAGRSKVSTTNPSRTSTGGGGSGIWGWVCMAVIVLLGVWVVIALVRAFTSGGGGGPGGGPGYGGGGGFMTSMLGGLFGAAAGMYLYDSFFRSGMPTDYGGSAYGNSPPPAGDDGAAGGGTGGDWGDDAAGGGGADGGDWGGGGGDAGGDWGGGGDGGGGDW